ncbi:MAG: hypothetical protein QF805_22600, partial [Pirellulaceae bacterium]|nr:hypothetical protein [Pirellulaceae bacterium]
LEQAYSFSVTNGFGLSSIFFGAATGGAAITAFYMFRLWYLTFAGKPRNADRYDHAHESPKVMYMPLVVLSVFAVSVAWKPFEAQLVGSVGLVVGLLWLLKCVFNGQSRTSALVVSGASFAILMIGLVWAVGSPKWTPTPLNPLLEQARPDGTLLPSTAQYWVNWTWPDERKSHDYAAAITPVATAVAIAGFALASIMYGLGYLNPDEVRRQFQAVYRFLLNKWWFDELYDFIFVRPTHVISRVISGIDRSWIDGFLHSLASDIRWISRLWDTIIDRTAVDGTIEMVLGRWTRSIGYSLRVVQTGRLRQYVMFIAIGAIVLFLLISLFVNSTPPVAQG